VHSVAIATGELFDANDIVELWMSKPRIELLKTEEERKEFFEGRGDNHTGEAWEMAYVELIKNRPQKLEELFTVHGPVVIAGEGTDDW